MRRNAPPGIFTIRGLMGVCHLLRDERGGAVFLDAGLFGEKPQMRRLLRRLAIEPKSIQAILVTHGHLDHAGNLAWLKEWTGAPILGHAAEQAHLDGTWPFTGPSIWCGRLERFGYRALNYRRASIDRFLTDGEELPFWDGLRVIHLPGHTAGHCGFYSAKHDVLFSGDLFASYFFNVHLPPAILNTQPALIPASLRRARALNPRYIVPQHYDFLDGELHRRRFDRLCRRVLGGDDRSAAI